jgi:2-polyprenyl-3-methyl-5-hydroxy-6-metoxy-1,4-benzoquinol methylase
MSNPLNAYLSQKPKRWKLGNRIAVFDEINNSKSKLDFLNYKEILQKNTFSREALAALTRTLFIWRRIRNKVTSYQNGHLIPSKVVVDVGCGTGILLETLWRNRRPVKYVGLDLSEAALNSTADLAVNSMPVMLIQKDVTNGIPLKNNCADVVVCAELIEHIEETLRPFVFKELHRILKIDGLLFLSTTIQPFASSTFSKYHHKEYTRKKITTSLRISRFSILEEWGCAAKHEHLLSVLSPEETKVYRRIIQYHPPAVAALLFAPFHPEVSQQIMFVCMKQQESVKLSTMRREMRTNKEPSWSIYNYEAPGI